MADKVDPRTGELTTANYGWIKPTVGASTDAWGGYINTDLDGIDTTVKSVSTVANAAYPASNPSGYQTAAQVTASLSPYALTASVPAASSTTPAMDGAAAIGTGTTWARADHVHPTDTSRAAASTLANYLPLAGVTDGSNAPAGQIGEVISSNVTTGVSLTTSVDTNITSISLAPGDWEISGEAWIATGTGGATQVIASLNTVSATRSSVSALNTARSSILATILASASLNLPLRSCRANLTATTTYYLIAYCAFPSGTVTATGNIIARRAR